MKKKAGKYFSPQDGKCVEKARLKAEELTGEHFKISRFGPEKYLYEVVTLREALPEEIAPGNFAHLIRYLRAGPGPGHNRKPERYYRVLLQDDEILSCLQRNEADFDLESLLLYILTHELIHIVRFERFLHAMDAEEEKKAQEESAVHRITCDILDRVSEGRLENVLSKYRGGPKDCFRLSDKT